MSAELIVKDLRKVFTTGRPAVDGVTFTVAAGEIVVLLGPSGCGKTTTLRSVAGLEQPTSGSISIGGRVVSAPEQGIMVPPRQREIGMVFQSYAVWPHMTVFDNVAYPLRHRRVPGPEMRKRVAETLDLVGLGEYAQRSVVALSGGQMQRVALARSLVYQPQILLLDEPLSNLDAKLRLRLRDDLRRIVKATGVTALYVTHDQSEAVVLGDRIGVMRDGRMQQLAPAIDLYNRPANLFVANFTGASNLLRGRVAAREGDFGRVRMGDGTVINAWLPDHVGTDVDVKVCVRPENMVVGTGEGPDVYTARVLGSRYQGTQTIYDIELFGDQVEVLELGTSARYRVGEPMRLRLQPDLCWAYLATEDAGIE